MYVVKPSSSCVPRVGPAYLVHSRAAHGAVQCSAPPCFSPPLRCLSTCVLRAVLFRSVNPSIYPSVHPFGSHAYAGVYVYITPNAPTQQIGLLKNDNVPDLVPCLLPRGYPAACHRFLRKWLLLPPSYHLADSAHKLCRQLASPEQVRLRLRLRLRVRLRRHEGVKKLQEEEGGGKGKRGEKKGGTAGGGSGRGVCVVLQSVFCLFGEADGMGEALDLENKTRGVCGRGHEGKQ